LIVGVHRATSTFWRGCLLLKRRKERPKVKRH
jgi:hypothetical protein